MRFSAVSQRNDASCILHNPLRIASGILHLICASTLLIALITMAAEVASSDEGCYSIHVDLPSVVANDVVVTDDLPQGLIFQPDSSVVTGAASDPDVSASGSGDGLQPTRITWSFGQVDNSADQDILIKFKAVVADTAANQDGATLASGELTLSWKDVEGVIHTENAKTSSVKVIEPSLQVSSHFHPTTADRGDRVTCTLTVRHTEKSHADAYDVNIGANIPQGLTYVPGSMEILKGSEGSKDDSNPGELRWHFDSVDQSWSGAGGDAGEGDQEIQLQYRATVDVSASPGSQMLSTANLAWASAAGDNPEKRSYSASSDAKLSVISRPPKFNIALAGYPNPVQPDGVLTYPISYRNTGGYAKGAVIQASYDSNTAFISADPVPDQGSNNQWTLGDLISGTSGTIEVTVGVDPALADGTMLTSSAKISSEDGASAQDTTITKVMSTSPALLIEKAASDQFIRPGGTLNYTITYQNSGNDEATNVTVTDLIDSNLNFAPADATPRASKIWKDADGTHLWWNASILKSETLAPGGSGKIEIRVSLPPVPEHPTFDWVYNNYKIDSDQGEGKFKTLDTAVIHSLYVRKKAEKQAYFANEMVNYTIIYGNELAVAADNAVVMDVLPDPEFMEFVEADPEPSAVKDNVLIWNIGTIQPKGSGTIYVYARIYENHSDVRFRSSESVSGQGYVYFDQRLDTAQKPDSLTNFANITAKYLGVPEEDSSSATIRLSDALGTAVKIIGHGSGTYSREDETSLLTKNRSIKVKTSLRERYGPSSFALPQGRSIDYSSKWSEAQSAKNRVTGASMSERYMYATRIDRDSSIELDKNGSILESETSFEGAGHIGMLKQSGANDTSSLSYNTNTYNHKGVPAYESQEDLLGSFTVYTKFDEYGKNVAQNRSVSGIGAASSDKRIGRSQRSFESGTGAYQVEEQVQTVTSYMAKEIDASHGPVSYAYTPDVQVSLSKKWHEGMWTRSGTFNPKSFAGPTPGSNSMSNSGSNSKSTSNSSQPSSFIGEEFSQADYLKKSTAVKGLNEMKTEAEFSGTGHFKVIRSGSAANRSWEDVYLDEEYRGTYRLARNIVVGGVAKFNEPHLSISKVGKLEPAGGSFVDYTITVVNDGNRALGPVYVLDLFPPGTQYVSSSLRPSEQNGSYARWTLVSLGIGASTAIDLKLNMTDDMYADSLVNRVRATGGYDGQWASAENYSAIQLNWLSCCPPQIWAAKTAYVDPRDGTMVHYSIILRNREKYVMAVSIVDQLPGGMMFQSSSIMPSDRSSDWVSGNIIDLEPGETRTIDYLAKAMYNGLFLNQAHIEAHAVDGADVAFADVAARVEIGAGGNRSSSTWQPPACFGLNCTSTGTKNEWIPCDACGTAEPAPPDLSCASCVPATYAGDGYEIP